MILLTAAMWLLSCGPDFSGEAGVYSFETTLSRPTVPWTPETPIAVGESFQIRKGFSCLFDCPAPFTMASMSPPNGVLVGDPLREVTATAVGTTSIVTNAARDRFRVSVVEPVGLRVVEPLELSRPRWLHLRNADGGPGAFPEVGEEIVMGPDASVYLDVTLVDADGGMVASRSGFAVETISASGTTVVSAQIDGRMIDLHSASIGSIAHATVSRLDGGFAQTWKVRVAGPEEIASIELVQISLGTDAIVRAVVRRSDGGVFLEPPLTWTVEGAEAQDYTRFRADLRARSDVMMFRAIYDAGIPRVTVTGAAITSSLTLDVSEASPPPVAAPMPPVMQRQSCATTGTMPALACVLTLAAFLRRRVRPITL